MRSRPVGAVMSSARSGGKQEGRALGVSASPRVGRRGAGTPKCSQRDGAIQGSQFHRKVFQSNDLWDSSVGAFGNSPGPVTPGRIPGM
jgi:hypothetical protein